MYLINQKTFLFFYKYANTIIATYIILPIIHPSILFVDYIVIITVKYNTLLIM